MYLSITQRNKPLMKLIIVGQIFKFVCGRWLGHNFDDGSTERYMVGYPMSLEDYSAKEIVAECFNPPATTW